MLAKITAFMMVILFAFPLYAQDTYWKDQQIMQLEELTPQLVESVQQIHEKIKSVTISSISFGDTLPDKFRKVATARLQQTLTQLSQLKVSVCGPCSQIHTMISGSFLKISRGIADDDFRIKTAKELNVEGFLDIAVFMTEDRQLSVSMNAYEAENGKIVYSKIITGEPAKKEKYFQIYYGKLQTSITHSSTGNEAITHQANQLGLDIVLRMTSDWTYSLGGSLFSDDNSNLTIKYEKGVSGMTVEGMLGYNLFSFGGNEAEMIFNAGMGTMIAAALNSPMYFKSGLGLTVSEHLTINFNYLGMVTSNDESFTMPSMINTTLGWKF